MAILCCLLSTACDGSNEGGATDSGTAAPDSGSSTGADAGEAGADAGVSAPDAGPTPGTCPLTAEARTLLYEVTDETIAAGTYVAVGSHFREVAFALFLPGVEEANLGVASLAFECMDESWYVPYCSEGGGITPGGGGEPSSPFWETRDRCGQLGCGGVGVDVQRVYMTMKPNMLPDERHVFTYDAVLPPASVTWAQNPLVLYRIERASADRWRVTAQFDHQVDFALTAGGTVALSHTGSIDADVSSGEIVTATFELSFPDIAGDAAVESNAAFDAAGTITGGVVHAGVRLAEWTGTHHEPTFTWLPPCAE